MRYIGEQGSLAKIRPDQSVVFMRDWPNAEKRLAGSGRGDDAARENGAPKRRRYILFWAVIARGLWASHPKPETGRSSDSR